MAMLRRTGSVTDADLLFVIEDTAGDTEADAESVEEVFPAGTEFTLNYDAPSGKTAYALYCMADCTSFSQSGNTITVTAETVRQVKSDGAVRESSLGYLTSLTPQWRL